MTLKELGYPTLEQIDQLGLTGRQFVDIVNWMQRGKKRVGDGWIRRVWPVTGWEVLDFINAQHFKSMGHEGAGRE